MRCFTFVALKFNEQAQGAEIEREEGVAPNCRSTVLV